MNYGLDTITMFNEFVEFKRSIKNLMILGVSDNGLEVEAWATMEDSDEDNPQYLKIPTWVVDSSINNHTKSIKEKYKWLTFLEHNVGEAPMLPFSERKFDIAWVSNSLHKNPNPLAFLKQINKNLNTNGMIYIGVPNTVSVRRSTFHNYTYAHQLNTFTSTQLLYLIAIAGFDVKDYHLKKEKFDDYLQIIAYKARDPFDGVPSWNELSQESIFDDFVTEIIHEKGFLTDQGMITHWIDGRVYDFRHHTR